MTARCFVQLTIRIPKGVVAVKAEELPEVDVGNLLVAPYHQHVLVVTVGDIKGFLGRGIPPATP